MDPQTCVTTQLSHISYQYSNLTTAPSLATFKHRLKYQVLILLLI